ncbi:hypothetical protein AGMMS50239_20580 [Bacteroidia bacterium]|nr:hypothetical protein AGMMS50239_20580 [Bacteroidia bacterium]
MQIACNPKNKRDSQSLANLSVSSWSHLDSYLKSNGLLFSKLKNYISASPIVLPTNNPLCSATHCTTTELNVHIGGRSALELLGLAHYLQVNTQETTVFVESKTSLPLWFTNNQWDTNPKIFTASLLKESEIGLTDFQDGELSIKIANATCAMMECLSLCPIQFPLVEAYELMEGLTSLRPAQVQTLLEQCKSIKVKRLFLYFAERAGHRWFKYLDTKQIDLGSGVRSLANDGMFVSKYQLVLPKEIVQ